MNYRFGKHPPKKDYRTLLLKKYLLSNIAAPLDEYDVLKKVYANLGISDPTVLFPMYGNDTLGDCTIAALYHAVTVWDGLVNVKKISEANDVIKTYMKMTGGIDSGLAELDVLNEWQSGYIDGNKIPAYASVDPKNHTHVKQAIQLFGGIYIGFQVPENCMDEFNAGQVWTPGNLTNDGHAVYVTAYDKDTVTVLTWGTTQKGTWDWWDECVDEAYPILPNEAKLDSFGGINFELLKSDLAMVS